MMRASTTTTTTDPSCPCGDDTVHQLPNKRNRALFKRHRGPVLLLLSCLLSSWNHHYYLQLAGSFSAERRHPTRRTRTTGHQHCPQHSHLNFLPLFATQQSQSPTVTFLEEEESRKNPLLDPETTSQIQTLLEQRAKARWNGDYVEADGLRDRLLLTVSDDEDDPQQAKDKLLPDGLTLWLQDLPRTQGGGTQWKVVLLEEEQSKDPPELLPGPTVLQLAHAALGLAVEHSTHIHLQRALKATTTTTTSLSNESDDDDDMPQGGFISNRHIAVSYREQLQSIVNQIRDRLDHQSKAAVAYELAGRKAADAAFWLALAGVSDDDDDDDSARVIYSKLIDVATQELKRFGDRPSCRVKDVHQILERFAAAGIQKSSPELLEVAQRCLELKEQGSSKSDTDIKSMLDFHSDRSLLLIWKFSTKQKKQRAFLQSAVKHWERHRENGHDTLDNNSNDPFKGEEGLRNSSFALEGSNNNVIWSDIFEDPTRPLVVDIGCGMGVSLLGLSCSKDTTGSKILLNTNRSSNTNTEVEWKDCNFVGVDLRALGIGYARAMAERWGIQGRTHFTVDAAEDFITKILGSGEDDVTNLSYPGPIRLVLIQFPTPYRLPKGDGDGGGNAQLPSSALDGFMVSPKLLQSVQKLLTRDRGRLLLQSNCEDVALWMRRTACDVADFEIVSLKQDEESSSPNQPQSPAVPERIPQRTADWIAMGGERAKGKGWYKHPLLPRKGATETEVACLLNGTPVHRTILQPKG